MRDFQVSVKKLTDQDLMREACEMTFLGKSGQSLMNMYKSEHSPARTQLFWITTKNIPLFIATHLLRHHVGSVPFQLTCRDDRAGGNPGLITKIDDIINDLKQVNSNKDVLPEIIDKLEWLQGNSDRYTPVNLGLLVNAQSLIDMAKLRLCTGCAHMETVKVFRAIKDAVKSVDSDLASMMVRKCVYRNGLCGESKCCGFNSSLSFQDELSEYVKHFTIKQLGLLQ